MAPITLTRQHIRPSDIDIWGHLNHSKAIELFELGRYDWISKNQISLDQEWAPVVTRIDVVYRREVFLSEIVIKTELTQKKHFTAEFRQAILIPGMDEAPAVTGRMWLSFLNKASRRLMRVRGLDIPASRQEYVLAQEEDGGNSFSED